MNSYEMRRIMEQIFGKNDTISNAAAALRCDEATLKRWLAGESEIPGPVVAALELAQACPPEYLPMAWRRVWLIDDKLLTRPSISRLGQKKKIDKPSRLWPR